MNPLFPHSPSSAEEKRRSRTHLYNISTQQKKSDCRLDAVTASDDLPSRIMWNTFGAREKVASFSQGLETPWKPRRSERLCGCIKHSCLEPTVCFRVVGVADLSSFVVSRLTLRTRVYKCACDVQLRVSDDGKRELFSWEPGHIFCFESFSTINIKPTWMWNLGKHCKSTQSQAPIHGQWSSSELYISMSSQIRVSALWIFWRWWRIVHE